jgi:hypothetical protein
MSESKVSKSELQDIWLTMKIHNRTEGYIGLVKNKWKFFDSNPSFGGTHITKKQIENSLKNFK